MSNSKKCSPTSTSTNVTIDQMIEHMTADLQGSSDGQYIQLGFTPPPTNDTTWPNYHGHHHHRMSYTPPYPPGFNNFIPSNQHFTNPGYILYNQPTNQDIQSSVPHGGVVIKHDFNGSIFEQQFTPNPNPYNLYQQQSAKQTYTSSGHLIENLVGNWTPNTSGTYSPFGGGGAIIHNHQPEPATVQQQPSPPIVEINVQNDVTNVKKPRMVAEVKPMRLRYSDVLARSVPSTPTTATKSPKVDTKDNVTKKQPQNKKTTPSKTSTIKIQNRNNDNPKPKSSTNWIPSTNNTTTTPNPDDLSDDVEFINNRQSKSERIRLNKNTESSTASSTTASGATGTSTQSSSNSSRASQKLTFEYRGDDMNNVRNNEKTFMAKSKKSKDLKKFGNSSTYGVSDKSSANLPSGRRGAGGHGRGGRRRGDSNHTHTTLGQLQRSIKQYLQRWSTIMFYVIVWLLHLISDVCSLSVHLVNDLCTNSWCVLKEQAGIVSKTTVVLFSKIQIFAKIFQYVDYHLGNKWFAFWNHGKNRERKNHSDTTKTSWHTSAGLDVNIPMPSTGEEAMKRLLACKGKDPYSILGVTPDCTDDDIKRYYKRQAFLVHPDKNQQPGAEEAFKILVHAFDIIGETERRQSYDRKVIESHQVEQAWSELNDLLSQLQQKMEYAANTIRCTNCTKRHRRIHVDRPSYAARSCAQCKIHHSVKEGDIWAESQCFGFLWYYYACMDGAIYDITEWASCQRSNLRHLRPNTHQVQYRIVLGKQQQHHHPSSSASSSFNSTTSTGFHHTASPGGGSHSHQYNSNSSGSHHQHHRSGGPKLDREPDLEDLEEFLNNLYQKTSGASHHGNPTGTNTEMGNGGVPSASSTCTNDHHASGSNSNNRQQDTTRNRKKNKRKK